VVLDLAENRSHRSDGGVVVRWLDLGVGLITRFQGGSGAECRKPSKTSRSIGFANAVFEDFESLKIFKNCIRKTYTS